MSKKLEFNAYNVEAWIKTIQEMTKDELLEIARDGHVCYPEFVKMAKERLEKEFGTPSEGTRDLFLETLTKMGCQYEIDPEDDRILFAYQGERFLADAENERPYVWIFDFTWKSVELHDIDEVSRLRRAINEANWQNSVTTVFTIDDEDKTMDVHCKATILFISQIPDVEIYLRAELQTFFDAHKLVDLEMAKLREKEEDTNEK